jgi:hypothetical protein
MWHNKCIFKEVISNLRVQGLPPMISGIKRRVRRITAPPKTGGINIHTRRISRIKRLTPTPRLDPRAGFETTSKVCERLADIEYNHNMLGQLNRNLSPN